MTNFVIRTQTLENYGANCEDRKFTSHHSYWKMEGGMGYLVQDL